MTGVLARQPAQFIGENNRIDGKVLALDGAACRVEIAGGTVIEATPVGVEPGAAVCLSIRPERIVVGPAAAGQRNALSAEVTQLIYHGDQFRIRLRLAGGVELSARAANLGERLGVGVGQTTSVGWSVESCRALRAP